MLDRLRNEPVMVLTFLVGVLTVVLQAVTDAGPDTNVMQAALVAVAAWLARSQVTPVAKL